MKVVKILFKDAEETKRNLIKNNLLNFNFKPSKDKTHLYFPLNNSIDLTSQVLKKFDIVNREMESIERFDLKSILLEKLSEKEYDELTKSFDVIGSIGILDLSEKFRKHEKFIADSFMKVNKQIKTVVKKEGFHGGEFRTQDYKHVAGVKTFETVHKENGINLKLDIREVYYSPRSGSERLRISNSIKPGERVLVMFSGCAPFPLVISRNSKAAFIVGIEKNPIGHKYGVESLKLNKNLNNILLLEGDVLDVIPKLFNIGVKTKVAFPEYDVKTKFKTPILEIYLSDDSLNDLVNFKKIVYSYKGDVIIHQSMKYKGKRVHLASSNKNVIEYYQLLQSLCVKNVLGFIAHPYYIVPRKAETVISNIKKLNLKSAIVETMPYGALCSSFNVFDLVKKADCKGICVDLAHSYIGGKLNILPQFLREYHSLEDSHKPYLYFHITDANAIRDGIEIGKGKIDFDALNIYDYIHNGVIEVVSKDEEKGVEMLSSYETFIEMKKFDRIVMPLPKSSHNFLDLAFNYLKKDGIINMYTFCRESDFPKEGITMIEEECKKANKKFKILNAIKCGSHSPGVFRTCIDFKIY